MEEKETSIVEAKPEVIKLTDLAIETIADNIKQAEKLVFTVLEKDVDYGIHPGTDSYALRDPGASKIINAFNCYADHKILYSQETEDLITFQIQANLISRQTGRVVGTGIGSCSTMESKYSHRWVENPEDYGYKREELKQRKGKYRIPNPEIADLGNTIFKMATKRAEVDACESLPGVGSALRKLFQTPEKGDIDWSTFWARTKQMGLSEDEVHSRLGVKSIYDWLNQEPTRTKKQALDILIRQQPSKKITKRDPSTIKTFGDLFQAIWEDFRLSKTETLRELNVSSQEEITELPSACYQRIAAVRTQ